MDKVFFYTFHTIWNVGLSVFLKKERKKRGKKLKKLTVINFIQIYPIKIIGL